MRVLTAGILPGIALATCAGDESCGDPAAVETIILREASRGPAVHAGDLVKLLYLGAMGPAHRGMNVADAARWLREEVAGLAPYAAEEPLVDTIAPSGAMVRVNLRPYLLAGGDPDSLAAWHVESARLNAPDPARLECRLRIAARMQDGGRLPASVGSLAPWLERLDTGGMDSPDHSEEYVAALRPAYRVVSGDYVPRLPAPSEATGP